MGPVYVDSNSKQLAAEKGKPFKSNMVRVAIIGAGPSGLSLLNALKKLDHEMEVVCYEKQDRAGGLWNYTWRTGTDKHGEPLANSMYRYLWSNGPKECCELADYTYIDHFKKPIPSFPPREVLKNYIMGRAEKNQLLSDIKVNHVVRSVEEVNDGNQFRVVVHDQVEKQTSEGIFDFVVVATGHFSYPNVPDYPGIDQFPGRVMHAHDFRDAKEFTGKRILLVGSSYSAEDIGMQCYKYGAKMVTMCYRSKPMGFNWPEGMEELPCLTKVNGSTVEFEDGSTREVDAILYCTGYQHKFPFLPSHLSMKSQNILYPANLYKGVVWNDNPRLCYIGMQDQYYTFSMFDAQAWWVRDYLVGKIELPKKDERTVDIENWYNKGQNLHNCTEDIDFQTDYMKDILKDTDYPEHDIELVRQQFYEWEQNKIDNIVTYREKCFKSACTGDMAPIHHTQWFKALDDSMEEFMRC